MKFEVGKIYSFKSNVAKNVTYFAKVEKFDSRTFTGYWIYLGKTGSFKGANYKFEISSWYNYQEATNREIYIYEEVLAGRDPYLSIEEISRYSNNLVDLSVQENTQIGEFLIL